MKKAEVCRPCGISEATYYTWKANYAGLKVNEGRRLKRLEEENRKLKRIVADLALDKAVLTDSLAKTPDACEQAGRGAEGSFYSWHRSRGAGRH